MLCTKVHMEWMVHSTQLHDASLWDNFSHKGGSVTFVELLGIIIILVSVKLSIIFSSHKYRASISFPMILLFLLFVVSFSITNPCNKQFSFLIICAAAVLTSNCLDLQTGKLNANVDED